MQVSPDATPLDRERRRELLLEMLLSLVFEDRVLPHLIDYQDLAYKRKMTPLHSLKPGDQFQNVRHLTLEDVLGRSDSLELAELMGCLNISLGYLTTESTIEDLVRCYARKLTLEVLGIGI